MKFLLFLVVCVVGAASGGFFSKLQETNNAIRQTAITGIKTTTNTAINTVKKTTELATDTAKNVTKAGVNLVKNLSTAAVNNGISMLLSQIRAIVKKTGKNVISIPDIGQKKGPISFNATKGYFKDVTTIVQDGKANVSATGTSLKIDIPLKLDAIDIGYGQFNVSMLGMKMGGSIQIHIKNDSFILHLRLTPGFTCALNVEKVEVAVLAGYDVDFSNVGKKSEWVLEKASSLIVNAIKGQIKSKVQSAIDSAVTTVLKEDSSICSKFVS